MSERIGYKERIKHEQIVRGLHIGVKVAEFLDTDKFSSDTNIFDKWKYFKNLSTNIKPEEIQCASSTINLLARQGFCTVTEYFYLKNIPDEYLFLQNISLKNKYFAIALFPRTKEEIKLVDTTKEILKKES